jgi:hypothetical protein
MTLAFASGRLRRRTFLVLAASVTLTVGSLAGGFWVHSAAGASDTIPPKLVAFDFSPKSVDVWAVPQMVTVTAHIADDSLAACTPGLGYAACHALFVSPTGQLHMVEFSSSRLSSGTPLDGFYQETLTIPAHEAGGTWSLYSLILSDEGGNSTTLWPSDITTAGFPAELQVMSRTKDTTPPTLLGFDYRYKQGGLDSAQSIVFMAHIADDLSGIHSGFGTSTQAWFASPGLESIYVTFDANQQTTGSGVDGWYRFMTNIPAHSVDATWTLQRFELWDEAGNERDLTANQVAALGFPTSFSVAAPGAR